nr:hypothetical protein L204_01968 [Cryptococcus depauperatus CBS 7855]
MLCALGKTTTADEMSNADGCKRARISRGQPSSLKKSYKRTSQIKRPEKLWVWIPSHSTQACFTKEWTYINRLDVRGSACSGHEALEGILARMTLAIRMRMIAFLPLRSLYTICHVYSRPAYLRGSIQWQRRGLNGQGK